MSMANEVFCKVIEKIRGIMTEEEVINDTRRFYRILAYSLVKEANNIKPDLELTQVILNQLSILTYRDFISIFPNESTSLVIDFKNKDNVILDNVEKLINDYSFVNKDINKLSESIYKLKHKMFTKC